MSSRNLINKRNGQRLQLKLRKKCHNSLTQSAKDVHISSKIYAIGHEKCASLVTQTLKQDLRTLAYWLHLKEFILCLP